MAMSAEQIAYVQLSTTATADIINGSTATFSNKRIAIPPTDFGSLQKQDFKVFLNNRRIPDLHIDSITQVGGNIDVVVDVAEYLQIPDAVLEEDDEVMLIGKFS